ncbi:hypothetical protein DMH04_16710 [Kibdelosporangium aridum]|uniref:Tat pathway signal sequence domain protein n=1 Tax=Kibdelosporangium aridum TaxID=2030 RepID=A0A428ZBY3_KIBAR|nr:hypothetical protein [Kibdelosporangium aridum]RSM85565.1 hypothetical protein DMH04_16710 [Kibdelosporangium aridum]
MSLNRRSLLTASIGASVLLLPGVAAASEFPPVPGMLGDRRANEMWYQFDEVAFYNASPEIQETYARLTAHVGVPNFVDGFRDVWLDLSAKPGYPDTYADFARPVRRELQTLSTLQLTSFDTYYSPNSTRFVDAFGWFGEGVLFDPRRAALEQQVHTMVPITNYHGWHAYLRAMMLLGVDTARWARINPVIGFAWAVQSVANPSANTPNPSLPVGTVSALRASWLPRTPDRLDRDFKSMPYPAE